MGILSNGHGVELPPIVAKAQRLIRAGGVTEIADARVFSVVGDHDTYIVVIRGLAARCTCPAGAGCSHVIAAVSVASCPEDPFAGFGAESAIRGKTIRAGQ